MIQIDRQEAIRNWQEAVRGNTAPPRTLDTILMAEASADDYALREGAEPPDPVELGWTPWGQAEHAHHLGNGVLYLETPSHGGLYLPDEVWNNAVPAEVKQSLHMVRNTPHKTNWAEEDGDLPLILPFIRGLLDQALLEELFAATD